MSVLLQHLKWILHSFHKSVAMNPKSLDGPDELSSQSQKQLSIESNDLKTNNETFDGPMLEGVHEISIYIHRFHNLDLFQQGWYQLKITIKWEDGDSDSFGTPSRVVHYEAPDLGSDDVYGVWIIDDADHSFSTQPFRIRYARQDVLLAMMVSFNLSLSKSEHPCTSGVILRFELLYSPVLGNRSDVKACLDTSPAAVHEFRLPPKALLGLHTYCPVHFDVFHAVLVDTSVHVSLLKSGVYTSSPKVASDSSSNDDDISGEHDKSAQTMLVRLLSSARDILLEEIKKIGTAINQPVDIKDTTLYELLGSGPRSDQPIADSDVEVSGQASDVPLNALELQPLQQKQNGEDGLHQDVLFHFMSEDEPLKSYDLVGDQVFHLWSTFLNFHRANIKNIFEFLRNQWAVDRKAEWSIWMVYTKVEMPHQYISSLVDDDISLHGSNGKEQLEKFNIDPVQTATMRVELHRRSIAQMRMNNRSIQDLQIFGDPSRIPIVVVERVVNEPIRSTSGNSYFSQLDHTDTPSTDITNKNGHVLRIVVFVHGFQGHHLDLRLIRNQWLLIDPKVEFLMSEANEDKTSGDFREMGQRLAQEAVSFIKKKMDKASRSGVLTTIKLNFVGHSIGNIILRTALTDIVMEPYLRYLHTYLSVSGPHLGYLYSSNSLFNGGLWVLKKLKGTRCIHQLTFTDDPDMQNTFLYKLSKQKTLEHFKNIILLSSPQDGYVPYHSARIQTCPASSSDSSKKGKAFLEMLNECMDQIRAPSSEHRTFMRCDVSFDVSLQGRNLDTIIGRAAHIEFLESDSFMKFIMWSFPDLFR